MTPCNSPIRPPISWEFELGFPFADKEKIDEPIEEIKIEEK